MNSSGDNTTPVPSRAVVNVRGDVGRMVSTAGRGVLRRLQRLRFERVAGDMANSVAMDDDGYQWLPPEDRPRWES